MLVALIWAASSQAQLIPRNLLQKFSSQQIREWLIPHDQWRPFPKTGEEWRKQLPDSLVKTIIANGEAALKQPFNNIPATVTLDYVRNGNRTRYENLSFAKRNQLFNLVLAEVVEDKGRFTDHIVDGIWSICEETYWGATAHVGMQKAGPGLGDVEDPTVDLFSAETVNILAWADYFVGNKLEKVSKLIRPRIYYEANRRVFTPLPAAKYAWMGNGNPKARLNNWAPWIMSNYVTASLLLETDPAKRLQAIELSQKITDQYINGLGDDGGCDEGPGYWFAAGGAVFDELNILASATNNKLNICHEPFIQKMAAYVFKTHIAGKYFINVADAHPEMTPDGLMLYRFGKAINNPQLTAFGSWSYHTLQHNKPAIVGFHRTRTLYNLFAVNEVQASHQSYTDVPDAWFSDVQMMVSRTNNDLFVASHAGNNNESHNHNDVGDFVIYADGYPVIIDVGAGTYTARTFGKQRYGLWFNTSPYHNLPVINGVAQGAGPKFTATDVRYSTNKSASQLTMNIKDAYPTQAGVSNWMRTVTANKSGSVIVTDNYQATSPLKTLTQSFMTICPTDITKVGKLMFDLPNGKKVFLDYNAKAWDVKREKMPLTEPEDQGLKSGWKHHDIYRIILTAKNNTNKAIVKYLIYK